MSKKIEIENDPKPTNAEVVAKSATPVEAAVPTKPASSAEPAGPATPAEQTVKEDSEAIIDFKSRDKQGFLPHSFRPKIEFTGRTPKVIISALAYKKMSLYVEIGSLEVGWLGTADMRANGDIFISDTFLLDQEVSAVETRLDTEGQSKLLDELMSKDPKGIEKINSLRFWGHSHVRMGTSPSSTDEMTMQRFASEGHAWYLRGIFNKLGKAEFTIYLFDRGISIRDAHWQVESEDGRIILEQKPLSFSRWASFWTTNPNIIIPDSGEDSESKDNKDSRKIRPDNKSELPAELIADDLLRQKITAEFKAKVRERSFAFWSAAKPATEATSAGPNANSNSSSDDGPPSTAETDKATSAVPTIQTSGPWGSISSTGKYEPPANLITDAPKTTGGPSPWSYLNNEPTIGRRISNFVQLLISLVQTKAENIKPNNKDNPDNKDKQN